MTIHFSEQAVRQLIKIAIETHDLDNISAEETAMLVVKVAKDMVSNGNLVNGYIVSDEEKKVAK